MRESIIIAFGLALPLAFIMYVIFALFSLRLNQTASLPITRIAMQGRKVLIISRHPFRARKKLIRFYFFKGSVPFFLRGAPNTPWKDAF